MNISSPHSHHWLIEKASPEQSHGMLHMSIRMSVDVACNEFHNWESPEKLEGNDSSNLPGILGITDAAYTMSLAKKRSMSATKSTQLV
jgi:hypothetical protein